MADVFISYHVASAETIVRQIAAELRKRGVTYWYSEGDMKPGFDFARVVPLQIKACKIFLLILDEGAIDSLHVENELGLAFKRKREITILPFRAEECALNDWTSYYLTHIQIMNNSLTPPLDKRIKELADYIAQLLGKALRIAPSAPPIREAAHVITLSEPLMRETGQAQRPPVPPTRKAAQARTPSALWTPNRVLWVRETIAASENCTVGLRKDGTVVAVGSNGYGQCNVTAWRDIVALSAGDGHTVGLRKDGAVIATVDYKDNGLRAVAAWRDIVALSVGGRHAVALRKYGKVVAVGSNRDGQCDVSEWRNIMAVSAGYRHTVGLRKDGKVIAVGDNEDGQCDVSDWRDIQLP